MALTDKQETFIREYLVDLNATQAAIRAGYSEKTAGSTGHENLKKPEIASRITELQNKRADQVELDANWVLTNLKNVVERSLQQEAVMKFDYEERKLMKTGEYQFDSQGANRALELIGKHLGMFRDKLDITGSMNVQIVDDIQ